MSARTLVTLMGELDTTRPVYEALAERIRLLIVDGRIAVGTRLPSERELAAQTGRSRTTIVAGYQLVRDAGYLSSRRGSGSRAILPVVANDEGAQPRTIDFARAAPPPVDGLRDIFARVGDRMADALDGPAFDLLGNLSLRNAIAQRYTDRGLPTTPEQIMVTMGGQHAISLAAQSVVARGDVVLVEAPTYPHAFDALRRAGARLITTPVTTEGWDIDHLVEAMTRSRPALAYLVPDFQNPTGASMAPEDRVRVVDAARSTGTTLIVDETTADLNIDRRWDDGPFARHARQRSSASSPEVLTIGSMSKSIWGGLRLGWIRADVPHIQRLAQVRPSGDLGTPQMEQLIAEEIMIALPRLLANRRELLREHRAVLTRLLAERLPQWDVPSPAGGLSLWVQLDHPASSAVTGLCDARGLSLVAGPKFSLDGAFERHLRLPFTSPLTDLRDGVSMLAEAWEQVTARPTRRTAVPRMPGVV